MSRATQDRLSAVRERVLNVLFDLLDSRFVNEWADLDAVLKAVAHLHRRNGADQLGSERVIDSVLDEQPVRAHASLTGIAKL